MAPRGRRGGGVSRSAARRAPRLAIRTGCCPDRSWLAPGLSVIGLLVIGALTLGVLNGNVPFVGGSGGGGIANRTPAPSNVVVVPEVVVPGRHRLRQGGQHLGPADGEARQLTSGGRDSMPSWAPDGQCVSSSGPPRSRACGRPRAPTATTGWTSRRSCASASSGDAEPEALLTGRIRRDDAIVVLLDPPAGPLSADGKTIAMISDGPDPTERDAVLQFYDLATEERTVPDVPENVPLGHQDPSWRFDGRYLLYVAQRAVGLARGAGRLPLERRRRGGRPDHGRRATSSRASRPTAGTSWRRKTSAFGNDVVILDAAHGRELLRITDDGRSWAPVWSPAGDAIAFLHIDGLIVDLKMATLDGRGPGLDDRGDAST